MYYKGRRAINDKDLILQVTKKDLRTLDVTGCQNLTKAAFEAVAENCPQLEKLKIGHTFGPRDEALSLLAKGCTNLTYLDVGHCDYLTDESVLTVVRHCKGLTFLAIDNHCPGLTVSFATWSRGGEAVARYYRQLATASLISNTAKAVAMGLGAAGKTSTIRTLATLETPLPSSPSSSAAASLKSMLSEDDDCTIALDIEELWGGMLQVYDFSGQPEYSPWQQLFLTTKTLHIIFAESRMSADLTFRQVRLQLEHLYCTVGDVPVLVVLSKSDLAASSEELAKKIDSLKGMINAWMQSMRGVVKGKSQVPNVFTADLLAVSAAKREGIQELAVAIHNALLANDANTGARLFPRFQSLVPTVYEHIRAFLRAVIYGEDEAVALANKPEKSGALVRQKVAGGTPERVFFLPFNELTTRLKGALEAAPPNIRSFFEIDGVATLLRDALVVFEGEGLIIHAEEIEVVHLVPHWLIAAVEGLADHRFDIRHGKKEQETYISRVADDWAKNGIREDSSESVRLLQKYASNGIADKDLLRAFFAPAMRQFNASFEKLIRIFEDQRMLFKRYQDEGDKSEYVIPMRVSCSPPEDFEKECKLTGNMKACELTGTFACNFVPPGFAQRLIAVMHTAGRYHRHYRLGAIITESKFHKNGPQRIFFVDIKKCQIHLRVQQSMTELEVGGEGEGPFIDSLKQKVEEMRNDVEKIAEYWRGLGLNFEEVRVSTASLSSQSCPSSDMPRSPAKLRRQYSAAFDIDSMNRQMRDVLSSNEDHETGRQMMDGV